MSAQSRHAHGGTPCSAGIGLLIVSDTRSTRDDRSGAVAREMLTAAGHDVVEYCIVPDDPVQIGHCVRQWIARADCDAVLVSGGTGVSPRDRTYEALFELMDMQLDGFGELFRMLSYEQVGSAAMLSRALGGVCGGKPLFALPGSPKAVALALEKLILPELGHLLAELRK